MTTQLSRRNFLFKGSILVAAPAIVRAENLMKIVVPTPTILLYDDTFPFEHNLFYEHQKKAIAKILGIKRELLDFKTYSSIEHNSRISRSFL